MGGYIGCGCFSGVLQTVGTEVNTAPVIANDVSPGTWSFYEESLGPSVIVDDASGTTFSSPVWSIDGSRSPRVVYGPPTLWQYASVPF